MAATEGATSRFTSHLTNAGRLASGGLVNLTGSTGREYSFIYFFQCISF